MKNSLTYREYLTKWYNLPALALTAFIFIEIAGIINDIQKRKATKKWHKGLKERVAGL